MKIEITSDRFQNKIALDLMRKYIFNSDHKKMKLLDVGSADNIIKNFLPKNIEYYSLELPKEEQDEDLRDYNHEITFNLDDGRIPVEDNTFDIIVCLDTLEHTMYPKRVLKEFKRITKKRGFFIISLPNEYNFLLRLYYLLAIKTRTEIPWEVVEIHQHIQKPRVGDIIQLLNDNFKIYEVIYHWESRASYKNKLFIMIDKFINLLARIYPSIFARDVVAICKFKSKFETPQKNKKNLFIQDKKYY
ncbi:MAG: class I SAM-dependent methyltransferase [Nanoarchaeota archaeon]